MTEPAFTKINNDTRFIPNEPVNYTAEIRQMMHGFGDSSEPLTESAKIIEDVVLEQMRTIIKRACEIADMRHSGKRGTFTTEDLIFLLRKDKIKLQRLIKYLELKEFKSTLHKVTNSEYAEEVMDDVQPEAEKLKEPLKSFLNLIDNTGELLQGASRIDEVKQQRCIRAEMMSRSMDEARYLKFSKARNASFANKNKHKFSDWLGTDSDIVIPKTVYNILGYLAYETVAQIIDLALIVRQDQSKLYGDAIDRVRLSHVNPYTYKPYYHGKVAVTKPLTPAEIMEALRRYWSPQLDIAGPFHRCSTRRPNLKLLSC